MLGLIVVIAVLVVIVICLIIYNLNIYKKVKGLSNTSEKIANLRVLQDFMDTIGKNASVENKIKIINEILIEKYQIKYSTIVVFNGAEYVLKASNVDERLWDTMINLHTDPLFQNSIINATPKYVTINNANERLSYQKTDMTRAKSAMFFPMYIDNIYIGYWIIESDIAHAFDRMDTGILEVIRENMVSVLKTISYQNTIENIYRVDKFTGLNSAEYLYGKGKRTIDKYSKSTMCMFQINNIEQINEEYGRKIGTQIIVQVANTVKSKISSEYVFVRYMGPKFAIVFSGVDVDAVVEFVQELKNLFTCPIIHKNDADLATVYESSFHKGLTLYLTFSTGIGGGLARRGILAKNSASVEPGHIFYIYDNQSAEWEDIASCAAIGAHYGCQATSVRGRDAYSDIAHRVSLGLPELIQKYRPDCIVIGGPLAVLFPHFIKELRILTRQNLPITRKLPRLVPAHRPHEAVVYGGYTLAKSLTKPHKQKVSHRGQ